MNTNTTINTPNPIQSNYPKAIPNSLSYAPKEFSLYVIRKTKPVAIWDANGVGHLMSQHFDSWFNPLWESIVYRRKKREELGLIPHTAVSNATVKKYNFLGFSITRDKLIDQEVRAELRALGKATLSAPPQSFYKREGDL